MERESIGLYTLNNFFLGKYHHPVEEERIFMFVDMKSSTTIAESLGHVRHFEMLKEYFLDLSGSVIDHAGAIYQYAGDEMIVSWKLKDGFTAGEIGSLKKEIIFTGDVLNTSARIQSLCNKFGADLLVSEDLIKVLQLPASYMVTSVGDTLLEGINKPMKLFVISITKEQQSQN